MHDSTEFAGKHIALELFWQALPANTQQNFSSKKVRHS